jgi:acetolactate synthase small subunit
MFSAAEPATLPTACFAVEAEPDPGVMPRVLELFAKRGLIPSQWRSALGRGPDAVLHIDIQVEGMEGGLAEYIANCLRQLPAVAVVLTSEKCRAQRA